MPQFSVTPKKNPKKNSKKKSKSNQKKERKKTRGVARGQRASGHPVPFFFQKKEEHQRAGQRFGTV